MTKKKKIFASRSHYFIMWALKLTKSLLQGHQNRVGSEGAIAGWKRQESEGKKRKSCLDYEDLGLKDEKTE